MKAKIEFCGIPGSGKSTLSEKSISLLTKRGYTLLSRAEMREQVIARRNYGFFVNILGRLSPAWRRSFLALPHGLDDWHRFVVKFPEFSAYLHKILARAKEDDNWRAVAFYAVLFSAYEHQLFQERNNSVLFDESFGQRCFSLFGYRSVGYPDDIVRYGKLMPLPNAMILVMAEPAVCRKRIRQRDHIPVLLPHDDDAFIDTTLRKGNDLFRELTMALRSRGVKVFEANGNGDLQVESEKVVGFLASIL